MYYLGNLGAAARKCPAGYNYGKYVDACRIAKKSKDKPELVPTLAQTELSNTARIAAQIAGNTTSETFAAQEQQQASGEAASAPSSQGFFSRYWPYFLVAGVLGVTAFVILKKKQG